MIRSVLFDFDFTLADSSAGILECTRFALESLGLHVSAAEDVRHTIGLSLTDSFRALSGRDDPAGSAAYVRSFVQRANEVMVAGTVIYPQTRHILSMLRERGIATAIVSTKFRYRIEEILRASALRQAVDVIVGGEDVADHKPHPAALQLALSQLGTTESDALYVGDHPVDGVAALRAGIRFVRVMTGARHGADSWAAVDIAATIENLDQLVDIADATASVKTV
jgi:phosphoglycolate phosphatase